MKNSILTWAELSSDVTEFIGVFERTGRFYVDRPEYENTTNLKNLINVLVSRLANQEKIENYKNSFTSPGQLINV